MKYDLKNEYHIRDAREKLEKLIAKGAYCELTEHKPQRSLSQNNYLYVILQIFACNYGCSVDYAKLHFFKGVCNPDLFLVERTDKSGRTYKDFRSSSELSVDQMTLAIDRFRDWASTPDIGIYIPTPNEHRALLYAQRMIEQNQEFLQTDLA